MLDLGDVVVTKKSSVGAILGLAVICLPSLALCLFMLANMQWSNPTSDELMGIGFVGIFAVFSTAGLYSSIRLRFDICENGIRARQLWSTLELPYSELKSISVRRTTSNQADLVSGKRDLGYAVEVCSETGATAAFTSGGFGSDGDVENAVKKMQDLVTRKLLAKLDAGQAVEWVPGLTIDGQRVRGEVPRSVLNSSIAELRAPPLDLSLDDPNVTVRLWEGHVTIFSGETEVARFGCDAPNYFPGQQVLSERSAWQFA